VTRQEMYDKLFVRFSKSTTKMGVVFIQTDAGLSTECIYRGNDNPTSRAKCAIGSCIPNSVYNPGMEGNSVENLVKLFPEVAQYIPKDLDFANEVQTAHDVSADAYKEDNAAARMSFLRKLNDIARHYNLTTQPLPH